MPLRSGLLRMVAGGHAVTRTPRPGRRVRRDGRARPLARPGPGRGRHRRIRHPDVLAPGAARGRRDRRPAAARSGHPRRRAGGPVDPGPAHRSLPRQPHLVDLRLQRGRCEHRCPRRPGRLPRDLAGRVRAGTSATVRGGRRAPDRVRLERSGFAGVLRTGDRAEVVGDRVHLPGRIAGDEINVGGSKASAAAVRRVLLAHPGVAWAQVRGRRAPLVGSVVTADVVLATWPQRQPLRRPPAPPQPPSPPTSPAGAPTAFPAMPSPGASACWTRSRSRRR